MWQAAHSEGRSVITEEHLEIGSADALLAFDNAVCEPICTSLLRFPITVRSCRGEDNW